MIIPDMSGCLQGISIRVGTCIPVPVLRAATIHPTVCLRVAVWVLVDGHCENLIVARVRRRLGSSEYTMEMVESSEGCVWRRPDIQSQQRGNAKRSRALILRHGGRRSYWS